MLRLNYGSLLCFGASKSDLAKLQKVQNRALQICWCADRYTSNLRLHRDTNILPYGLRMKLETYKMMFNRMLIQQKDESPENPPGACTRSGDALLMKIDRPFNDKFLRSVTYQGPKLWNELPSHIRNLGDTPTFDREIRNMLRDEFNNLTSIQVPTLEVVYPSTIRYDNTDCLILLNMGF